MTIYKVNLSTSSGSLPSNLYIHLIIYDPIKNPDANNSPYHLGGNPDIISGFENILENLENVKILDARSTGEYDGSIIRAAQSGHIPNSINIDWNQNIKEDGTFKNDEELSKMYDYPKFPKKVKYSRIKNPNV